MENTFLCAHLCQELSENSEYHPTLTSIVRQRYFQYLKKIIYNNVRDYNPEIVDESNDIILKHAQEIELKVVNSCMLPDTYRREMLKAIHKIRHKKESWIKFDNDTKPVQYSLENEDKNIMPPDVLSSVSENEAKPFDAAEEEENDEITNVNNSTFEEPNGEVLTQIPQSYLAKCEVNSDSSAAKPYDQQKEKDEVYMKMQEIFKEVSDEKLHSDKQYDTVSNSPASDSGNLFEENRNDLWKVEDYIQTSALSNSLSVVSELNPEKYQKLTEKFKVLFDSSFSPPYQVNNQHLIQACKTKITFHVSRTLSRYFMSCIVSTPIFKKLCKSIVMKILAIDPYIDAHLIKQTIHKLFYNNRTYISNSDEIRAAVNFVTNYICRHKQAK